MAALPGGKRVDDLPVAVTLSGAEQFYGLQSGGSVQITVDQIRAGRATLIGVETLTNKTLTAPAINGGTLDGNQTITSQSAFRTALGLGTMAVQAASAVAITGGTIAGITDLAVADGGTGASTAGAARTNLGLVIGTDVQAFHAALASIAGLTTAADKMIYTSASNVYAAIDLTSVARTLIAQTTQANMRTTGLGLGDIATQAASAVALTGGTINNVTIGATTANTIKGTTINATTSFMQNGTKVIGAQQTGWVAMTGAADSGTAYDVATITTAQLASRVKSIQSALTTHGLIAT